jgi:hypothetical protein
MKKIHYFCALGLFLASANSSWANDMQLKTAACRLEVKILGYETLEEDQDCIWLMDNLTQVVKKCPECRTDLKLIKEASQGYFDY